MQGKTVSEETIEKRVEKSVVSQYHFGKVLLDKIYNCVLFEIFNKLFCY